MEEDASACGSPTIIICSDLVKLYILAYTNKGIPGSHCVVYSIMADGGVNMGHVQCDSAFPPLHSSLTNVLKSHTISGISGKGGVIGKQNSTWFLVSCPLKYTPILSVNVGSRSGFLRNSDQHASDSATKRRGSMLCMPARTYSRASLAPEMILSFSGTGHSSMLNFVTHVFRSAHIMGQDSPGISVNMSSIPSSLPRSGRWAACFS